MASGAGDRVSSSWSKFESLAVFGVATVDFGLGFTPLWACGNKKQHAFQSLVLGKRCVCLCRD